MITFEQARDKAIQLVKQLTKPLGSGGDKIVLNDLATQSFECGWIFYWQNRDFIETGDISHMLAGNAPLIVDRNTGEVHVTGTGRPTDYYVSNYRLTGDPHREPVWHLIFSRPNDSANVAEAVRLFRDMFDLPLRDAKRTVDSLLDNQEYTFEAGTHECAVQLSAKFREVGFPSQLVAR